jgi:hypothetical protein
MKRICLDAGNLDIPDEVMEHPLICNLGEAANDLVTWSNVSVSPFSIKHQSKYISRTSFLTTSSSPKVIPIT